MGPKLRQFTDAIAEMVASDGFSLGKTFRDYIPFQKEHQGLLFGYNFDVMTKYGLQLEARFCVRHHQTEEIYKKLIRLDNRLGNEATVTNTLYASVGRISAWKQPFWNIVRDPLVARVSLNDEKQVVKAIKKQKELYFKYVRDAFVEMGSLRAIEQHLNRDISKEALYAESRYHRAARGIITGRIAGRQDWAQLAAAHRVVLCRHKYFDMLDAYDNLVGILSTQEGV